MMFGISPSHQGIPALPERKKPLILVIDPAPANRRLIAECLAQLPDVQTLVERLDAEYHQARQRLLALA